MRLKGNKKKSYEEKLPALKAMNQNEDYNRIQNKLTPLQKNMRN